VCSAKRLSHPDMDAATLVRAKDLAARHLGRRMRSERETELYLKGKGFAPEIIARVVRDFRRVGLLNDRTMAREFAERRLANRPCGRLAIERELRARGVGERAGAEALEEVYPPELEKEKARSAAAKYGERLRRVQPEARARRLYRFLVGRGFSRETVSEFFEEMES
jgi:regulatory protein